MNASREIGIRWVGLALMLAAPLCGAQGAEDAVRKRLAEMKGDDDQAAMVAEMELMTMGDKALEPLKKIIDDAKDAERAEAMKVYPKALEKAGRLTRVSLNLERATFEDAAAEMNRQCPSLKIEGEKFPAKITLHRDKVPYALALAEICQSVDGSINPDSEEMLQIWREPGSKDRPISEDWGSVMILNDLSWKKRVAFEETKRSGPELWIEMSVLLDPKLDSYMGGILRDVEAIDETGARLDARSYSYTGSVRGFVQRRDFVFPLSRESKKLARLSGKMGEYAGYDAQTWDIGDASKAGGAAHDFGTIRLEIEKTEASGGELKIRGKLSGVPRAPVLRLDNDDIYQVMKEMLSRGITFESADGKGKGTNCEVSQIFTSPLSRLCQCEFELNLKSESGKTPVGATLKATLPRKFGDVWFGFDFKDIELP
jgi:hypothetical protein